MQRAIATAWQARRHTSPRPWVGAVVLPADADPASGPTYVGATDGGTGDHAEVVALRAAGPAAHGATLYCTLEPCAHHAATPPCAEAVVAAGVRRVVVGVRDPDERVTGRGLALLEASGIEVTEGVCESEVAEQLAAYLTHRRTGRPHVVLKLALTLDGRIAAADGSSRWITSEEARQDAHRLRADSDAILVGAGTVRTDDPALTVRLGTDEPAPEPLRVVLGAAPEHARIRPALEREGDLSAILDELGGKGVLQVLVEGGASVAHAFHSQRLVDRYVLYLAGALAGGDDARPAFSGSGASTVDDLWRGDIVGVRRVGPDVRIDLVP